MYSTMQIRHVVQEDTKGCSLGSKFDLTRWKQTSTSATSDIPHWMRLKLRNLETSDRSASKTVFSGCSREPSSTNNTVPGFLLRNVLSRNPRTLFLMLYCRKFPSLRRIQCEVFDAALAKSPNRHQIDVCLSLVVSNLLPREGSLQVGPETLCTKNMRNTRIDMRETARICMCAPKYASMHKNMRETCLRKYASMNPSMQQNMQVCTNPSNMHNAYAMCMWIKSRVLLIINIVMHTA